MGRDVERRDPLKMGKRGPNPRWGSIGYYWCGKKGHRAIDCPLQRLAVATLHDPPRRGKTDSKLMAGACKGVKQGHKSSSHLTTHLYMKLSKCKFHKTI